MIEKSSKTKVKRASSQKKSSVVLRFLKLIFFVFLAFISLILLCYFFVFPSIINNDISIKNIVIVSDKLDVSSNNIYFAHIAASEEKNIVFSIPADEEIEVPNGYGEYALQSVYQLLKIDKRDDHFIRATYSELLGISVDEIFTIDEQITNLDQKEISQLFLRNSLENLLKLKLHKVYSSFYLHYKFKNMEYHELDNKDEIKDYREDIFSVSGDVYQYCSVAVINASQVDGLARKKADEIENTGALVVRVDDTQQTQDSAKIYFGQDPVNCESLANIISNIFYKKPDILSIDQLENAQQYRAKVVVIVGEEN